VGAQQPGDPMTLIVSLYESEWIRALEGTEPPELETLVDRMDEAHRPTLRERLSVIERQYRARLPGQSGSVGETISPTIPPQSSPPMSGTAPTLPPSAIGDGRAAIDETVTPASGDTRRDASPQGVDTAPQMTLDFDGKITGREAALDVRSPAGY
jgi:hypothetical protein